MQMFLLIVLLEFDKYTSSWYTLTKVELLVNFKTNNKEENYLRDL